MQPELEECRLRSRSRSPSARLAMGLEKCHVCSPRTPSEAVTQQPEPEECRLRSRSKSPSARRATRSEECHVRSPRTPIEAFTQAPTPSPATQAPTPGFTSYPPSIVPHQLCANTKCMFLGSTMGAGNCCCWKCYVNVHLQLNGRPEHRYGFDHGTPPPHTHTHTQSQPDNFEQYENINM